MRWITTAERMPKGDVLIFAEGQYHVATLIGKRGAKDVDVFMDVHSSSLLPWPSHWSDLPPPPNCKYSAEAGAKVALSSSCSRAVADPMHP